MKTEPKDAIAALARLADAGASDAELLLARRPAVAACDAKRPAVASAVKEGDTILLPLEVRVAECIRELEVDTQRLMEGRQQVAARIRALEVELERDERVLASPGAQSAAWYGLGRQLEPLSDLSWKGPAPSNWTLEARQAWWDTVRVAGAAHQKLALMAQTPEEVEAARELIAAAHPGAFAAKHRELCQPFEAPAGGF